MSNKSKKKPITLNKTALNKIKSDVCDEATSRATLLFLLAAKDELILDDDKLAGLAERASRYAEHLSNHLVELKEAQEIIERKTGLKFVGF
jgi:CRISPR/Cas system CMR-associated protein Cmr5 small subunit